MPLDIVSVADGPRMSLGVALGLLVARKTSPDLAFNVAIPKDSEIGHDLARDVLYRYTHSIYEIEAPIRVVDGHTYRIENKVNALAEFGSGPAVLLDSDTLIIRPMHPDYLLRASSTVVPEHGLHLYPWDRFFEGAKLQSPEMLIRLGSGEVGPVWFNAGLVATRNARAMGEAWIAMSDYITQLDDVANIFPYLDQIALPLAIAHTQASRSVSYENVLDLVYNQNIFYWASDQSYVNHGVMVHHHNRIKLVERYCQGSLDWAASEEPQVRDLVEEMRQFDDFGKEDFGV